MFDRILPIPAGQREDSGDRADPDPARVAELLAQIGVLGERIDAAAQRSVGALRQARDEPGIATWDGALAESLLDLAARIETGRQRLDAALAQDLARLRDAASPLDEPAADAQAVMDPSRPGMI